jgi:hypothetical protein
MTMLGRTHLYQETRSPLIRGERGGHRRRAGWWSWVLLAAVVVAAVLVYVTYLR